MATRQRISVLDFLGDNYEPLWDKTNPNKFYYHVGNALMQYHVDTDAKEIIRTFGEYGEISGKGESSLSEDGNHLVLAGDNQEIFVYQFDVDGKGLTTPAPAGIDSIMITPDNNVLVSGQTGMYLYSRDMEFLRKIGGNNGHKGVMRSPEGEEVLVWFDNVDYAIKKVRLVDNTITSLIPIDITLAVHISCPRKGPSFIFETYNPDNPNPNGGMAPLANSICQGFLDGSAPTELLKHGSSAASYTGQPLTTISDDGTVFAFGSNKAGPMDVYLGVMAAPQPSPVPPAPIPVPTVGRVPVSLVNFPNQGPLTKGNFPAKLGEAGFVYDGTGTKLILNDGHKWVWPGTLLH